MTLVRLREIGEGFRKTYPWQVTCDHPGCRAYLRLKAPSRIGAGMRLRRLGWAGWPGSGKWRCSDHHHEGFFSD